MSYNNNLPRTPVEGLPCALAYGSNLAHEHATSEHISVGASWWERGFPVPWQGLGAS